MAATQIPCLPVMGAVLAGGSSRRMGKSKADIPLWDGRSMMTHVITQVKTVCPNLVIVGGPPVSIEGVLHLPDITPHLGPLGGLKTLLASGRAEAYLVVACDQPFLTSEICHLLLMGDSAVAHLFRPHPGQPVDPFPGYYPALLLSRVSDPHLPAEEDRSMQNFIRTIPVTFLSLPASLRSGIKSLNTPEDLKGWG